MKSVLTKHLEQNAGYFLDLKNKFNIKLVHFINAGLLLNAAALINLFNKEFIVFFGLFAFGYFFSIIENIYDEKSKLETHYSNLALWVKVISLYYFVSVLYYKKINGFVIALVFILLILCNINYSIDYLIRCPNKKDIVNDILTYPYKNWSKSDLLKASEAIFTSLSLQS